MKILNQHQNARRLRWLALMIATGALAACVTEPPPPPAPRNVSVPVASEAAPGPDARIYAYPKQGQSEQQLDRDRYECHTWAVKQSGFDPSGPNVPPHQRVVVVREGGPTQGQTTAAGAFTGAVIGAAVSRPRDAGAGAVVGAIAGGLLGAVAGADQRPREERVVQTQRDRDIERSAANYRRAIGACMDARGYSVR